MKLEHGVVVPQRAELAEQKCVKTLLQMPCIFLVDDDSPDDEHGTAAVSSGLIYETQIQTDPRRVRAPPKRGTFCESAEEQAHGTEYFGPLRCEHDTRCRRTVQSDSERTSTVFSRVR